MIYGTIEDDWVLAITLISSTINYALTFVELIKDKNVKVITGGVGTTLEYKKILESGLVDYACIGEGEEALTEACIKLSKNEDVSDVKNIYTLRNGKIKRTPLRKTIDINNMLLPDFSIYEDWRLYRPFKEGVVRMIPIEIDRGCPYVCTYCAAPVLQQKMKTESVGSYYRVKSFDVIFREIKELVNLYNVNFLYITSETFLAMNLKKFTEFAKRYKEEINLPF